MIAIRGVVQIYNEQLFFIELCYTNNCKFRGLLRFILKTGTSDSKNVDFHMTIW